MKMRKFILPFLGLVLLLCSCQRDSKNAQYNMLLDEIDVFETNLSEFALEIDIQIADGKIPYDVMQASYEDKDMLQQDMDALEAILTSLDGIISDKTYSATSQMITPLAAQAQQITFGADEYYIDDVSTKIDALLDEYTQLEDKRSVSTLATQNLMDELSSLVDHPVLGNPRLQGQSMILASFISCRDSYNDFINASEQFSIAALSSQNRGSSRTLVKDYLFVTEEYYAFHAQSLSMVTSLDTAYHKNTKKFTEIFAPLTPIYEATIENLDYTLDY